MPGTTLGITVSADSRPFFNEMARVSAHLRQGMQRDLATWAVTGAAPDPAKLFAKQQDAGKTAAGGFFQGFFDKLRGTGSGSMAQLVSVVSNTLSSLGSGMSPARILMQQGPNVAQAFVSMSDDLVGIVTKYLINPITGALAGLGLGAVAAFYSVRSTIDYLTGFQVPDFKVDYIASYLQKTTTALRIQREIESSVTRTADAYFAVSRAADLAGQARKNEFNHLRRMNQLGPGSPEEKARREADLNARERAVELADKEAEYRALIKESQEKEAQAKKLLAGVGSSDADKARIENAKALAAAAKERVKQFDAEKSEIIPDKWIFRSTSKQDVREALNSITANGVSLEDLRNREKEARADARGYEVAAREAEDAALRNEKTRKRADELTKQATTSSERAGMLGLDLPRLRTEAALANRREAEETQARIMGMPTLRPDLTANQRIGAFAMSTGNPQLQAVQSTAQNTAKTVEKLDQIIRDLNNNSIY